MRIIRRWFYSILRALARVQARTDEFVSFCIAEKSNFRWIWDHVKRTPLCVRNARGGIGSGSVVLLRPNKMTKIPEQSAENWICVGKWAYKNWAKNIFPVFRKAPDDQIFRGSMCYLCLPCKKWTRKLFEGRRKEINAVLIFFNFHENDYNLTENTIFLARSMFSTSSANPGLMLKNNGVLEFWHQGEFAFVHLAGVWGLQKSIGPRQTDSIWCLFYL